ncbi:UNVERIFIED_CONTAM: Zeta-carotene desaturase, chloroplastic/chromoplastic [Sesamum calycinum]|uniref:Zeta-carotene desaturase, chloroplastic/chromoplastic n=1 Tax=Sesamum calycinum TaxID=2727403 RepID=A0AAW2SXT0_9LAMI
MKVIERQTEDEVVGMAVAATPAAAACLCSPPNGNFRIRSAGFCNRHYSSQFKGPRRLTIRSDLESNVSDMRVNAPKGLFPPEPEHYKGPKLKVAIIGAGLAGMSTAVELLDQGHEVDIYESRSFVGGKVGSYVDKQGNHIEMGLHVFFGCYNNLFRLMKKTVLKLFVCTPFLLCGNNRQCLLTSDLLLVLIHPVVTSVSLVRVDILKNLIFVSQLERHYMELGHFDDKSAQGCWFCCREPTFATTYDIARNAVALALSPVVRALVDPDGAMGDRRDSNKYPEAVDPVAYALGFIDCDNISARCYPKKIVQADAYVAACDVPGIKRLLPQNWRESEFFDNIYKLVGVPVVTVQLRYNGWVTELRDLERARQLRQAAGLDNLLYTPDADFSCFADLALTSPEDYYLEGQGSLLQCVLTPGDPYMPLPNEEIVKRVSKQVLDLFPSSQGLEVTWSSVVKIGQSLYREGPGKDPFRPDQKTPVKNFFLAGSYTKQDYIDSMEGATLSGRQASAYICRAGEDLVALRKALTVTELKQTAGAAMS